MKKLLVIASAAILLAGCTRNTSVYVSNLSAATLTNIVASGPGFSLTFGRLAPGAQQEVTLNLKPNTVKLEFDANGRHFSNVSSNLDWNGMKGVGLEVTTNFSIDCGMITTF